MQTADYKRAWYLRNRARILREQRERYRVAWIQRDEECNGPGVLDVEEPAA